MCSRASCRRRSGRASGATSAHCPSGHEWCPLLKELVEFDGLRDSMTLAQFHLPTDVATRFPVEIGHYLSTLLDRWRLITHHPDLKEAKFRLDSVSVELLAGLWPAAPQQDRDRLDTLFTQADFLPSVGTPGLGWPSSVRCWTWTGES
jgi:hypothetical protein